MWVIHPDIRLCERMPQTPVVEAMNLLFSMLVLFPLEFSWFVVSFLQLGWKSREKICLLQYDPKCKLTTSPSTPLRNQPYASMLEEKKDKQNRQYFIQQEMVCLTPIWHLPTAPFFGLHPAGLQGVCLPSFKKEETPWSQQQRFLWFNG